MKMTKVLSALLTVVMLFGTFGTMFATPIFGAVNVNEAGDPTIKYLTQVFETPEAKLETMVMVKDQNGYELWVEDYSGEVAVRDKASGQILFTNPFDIAQETGSESVKNKLMSQIIIKYVDNDQNKTMNSYVEAAQRGQILVKNIKNGIRVEYTMGREETRRLVPRLIEKSRFETAILAHIDDEWSYEKLKSFYTEKDPDADHLTERARKEMQARFPITLKMAVYVCDPDIKDRELNQLEGIIKTFVPTYTYEVLDEDHSLTEYVGTDRAPALFKLALEYTLDDYGLSVRLPANGLRFDESNYQLESISMLPYMGTGSNRYTGYTFLADGAGTLFRFEDLIGNTYNVAGKIYGKDYAYHKITGTHQEIIRLPVYGIVTNYNRIDKFEETDYDTIVTEGYTDEETGEVFEPVYKTYTVESPYKEDKGFVAIITEGDALAELTSEHGGLTNTYNSVYPSFYPRPSDTYNLADSISIGGNAEWTVVSSRKYVGSYRVRYIMLTDEDIAAANGIEEYYEPSYVGMALAYRDYLYSQGTLTQYTEEDVKKDIPLYIETFGSIETLERILSFPVEVDTPLTTFENIMTMHQELAEQGITNLNFRLTGFANGGLDSTYPYYLKWMKSVGGANGFEELLDYAAENDIGIYPDFDFAYIKNNDLFDGIGLKKNAVKTIDNRYTSRRYYDAATQSFVRNYELAISPSRFEDIYEAFSERYLKYEPMGISVSTLGTDLNSDFDKKDPYNREDAKKFTIDLFEEFKEDYASIMTDGGNSYILPYVDHVLNASLDSSRYTNASNSVPFLGMVLHGSMNFAGTPINMEGDVDYALLKAIENGSSLYFTLSYQNTSELKEFEDFSKYYSIRYDIWFDELVEKYNLLNNAIGDLQTSLIVDHEFMIGERVPDADEVEADALAEQLAAEAQAEADAATLAKLEREQQLAIRKAAEEGRTIQVEPVKLPEKVEEVVEETEGYPYTKYTSDDGSIVRVEYEGNVSFILNYNNFAVTVVYEGVTYEISAYGFARIG